MKKIITIIIALFIIIFLVIVIIFTIIPDEINNLIELLPKETEGYTPSDGFIPDEKTAKKVAEAVWIPIYGRNVLSQKTYKAILIDEKIWLVQGSLGFLKLGGTAYIEIDKYTGQILKLTHFK